MSNSDIEQAGTVKGHIPNVVSLSGNISIGRGSGDFIIKMTVVRDDYGNLTVTSCDTTVEQIDAAVAAERRVVVIASYGGDIVELPMLQGSQGDCYSFGAFLFGTVFISFVYKIENTSSWEISTNLIDAGNVSYYNDAMPNVTRVRDALDELVPKSHTHSNKGTLDKLSDSNGNLTYNGEPIGVGDITAEDVTYTNPNESWANAKQALDELVGYNYDNGVQIGELAQSAHTHDNKSVLDKLSVAGGKLQYNGSDVGLKGDKGDTGAAGADGYTPVKGTDYWTAADKQEIVDELKPSQVTSGTSMTLADNTEYRLTDVTELTITYPNGNFECWMRLAFAAEGAITVTLPATTQYIGTTPTFANGETWELSIKDGVVVAGMVV